MSEEKIEVKPCPKCLHDDPQVEDRLWNSGGCGDPECCGTETITWYVRCGNYLCRFEVDESERYEDDAIKAWNECEERKS